VITSDTDASIKWCSTPPLWHIDATGGVHPISNITLVNTGKITTGTGNDNIAMNGAFADSVDGARAPTCLRSTPCRVASPNFVTECLIENVTHDGQVCWV
jgi:hypothetical protein